VYTKKQFAQIHIEHVDQLPAKLANLQCGTDTVLTQLYDEIARVRVLNTDVLQKLREEINQLQEGDDKLVQEIREQFTQLSYQNQATEKLVTDAIVRTRTLETELDTQRQKHVELSDLACRAYILQHAAVVATVAKEERTRDNAAVMAQVLRLSRGLIACTVNVLNEVVVTNQSFHHRHPVVPLTNLVGDIRFLDCTTCLIVTVFRVFKDNIQQLDNALAYICEIANEPLDAFEIYRFFLKELFLTIMRLKILPSILAVYFPVGVTRGFNFDELLFMNHVYYSGNRKIMNHVESADTKSSRYMRLERKMLKVFRHLRLKANPLYGIPSKFTENQDLKEYVQSV